MADLPVNHRDMYKYINRFSSQQRKGYDINATPSCALSIETSSITTGHLPILDHGIT